MACVGFHMLASLPANNFVLDLVPALSEFTTLAAITATVFGALAIPAGCVALYYMYRCYRIKARPFWNHWQTATSFAGSMLTLGAVVIAVIATPVLLWVSQSPASLLSLLGGFMAIGIALEGIGLSFHHKDLSAADHEGAASHYIQRSTFGKTYLLRNGLMGLNFLAAIGLSLWASESLASLMLWTVLLGSIVITALIGRALFYVLVVPTMPGAFFWKNKGFEQHARDIGLADMPQVGVAPLH